ncbi:hypothetical protein RHGRI_027509 [Rhododendron griersonianum]|uniref:Uncharacterized protein n=1 Tax=Rhododendron griersonianum TaxID=479676 RepID=A0AAV6J172_9ERIC|nr:hypothetical protein RHGRI_027509 [Rhododendron griersonianum]
MATNSEAKVTLKLLIDTKRKKLLFAEAEKDFVDFFLHLLLLPVGTVVRLLTEQTMVGTLGNLYESVRNLKETYFQSNQTKDSVLKPKVLFSATQVPLLSLDGGTFLAKTFYTCPNNIGYSFHPHFSDNACASCRHCSLSLSMEIQYVAAAEEVAAVGVSGFVKGVVTYMVMDDLVVTPMSTSSVITMLNKLNVKDVGALEERVTPSTRPPITHWSHSHPPPPPPPTTTSSPTNPMGLRPLQRHRPPTLWASAHYNVIAAHHLCRSTPSSPPTSAAAAAPPLPPAAADSAQTTSIEDPFTHQKRKHHLCFNYLSLPPGMFSILNSQEAVLSTAMAVSGIIILLALCLQKSFPASQFQSPPQIMQFIFLKLFGGCSKLKLSATLMKFVFLLQEIIWVESAAVAGGSGTSGLWVREWRGSEGRCMGGVHGRNIGHRGRGRSENQIWVFFLFLGMPKTTSFWADVSYPGWVMGWFHGL